MKTGKLRLISALLAVAMMVLLTPTAAFAATETTADGLEYEVTVDGEAYIVGYSGRATEVEIPSTLDGKTVTKIGTQAITYAVWGNNHVTSVKIPPTVKTIDVGVFVGCTNLTTVDLSEAESLEIIGAYAFQDSGLTSVCIPANVTKISLGAFYGCANLQTIDLSKAINLKTIGYNAFSGISGKEPSVTEITIPASVTEIDGGAFGGCSQLKEVTFAAPSNLCKEGGVIGENAFRGCPNEMKIYCESALKEKLSGVVDENKISITHWNVSFVTDDNTTTKLVEDNKTVDEPTTAPTREGNIFAGWYTKDESENWADNAFDFSKPITSDMILYARWATNAAVIEPATQIYPITIDNGTAYIDGEPVTEAKENDVVTIVADENAFDGMVFERWEIREGDVTLENDHATETTFTMPAGPVRLEAMPKMESDDSSWDAATIVTGAVIGTGTAILAYHIGTELYAEQVLGKDAAVPRTRGEVALLAWQLAGKPESANAVAPLTDEAKAQQWAVESGLLKLDAEGNFNAEKKLSKWKALRVLDKAQKLG